MSDFSSLPRGLLLRTNYITDGQAENIVEYVDSQPWSNELRRRVQHYGYRYDYKSHKVTPEMAVGPLPECIQKLAQQFYLDSIVPHLADQVIANEYQPGQGIAPHIDCIPCFADYIAILSLGSSCVMDFSTADKASVSSVLLEPNSLLVLSEESRYGFRHSIAPRKSDKWEGAAIRRQRRVSLTFRKVLR